MDSRKIAWMKRKDEVTARVGGGRAGMAPSRRAFRYLAWLSRSIPMLAVAVGLKAGRATRSQLSRSGTGPGGNRRLRQRCSAPLINLKGGGPQPQRTGIDSKYNLR